MSASALSPAWEAIITTLERAVEWSTNFVSAGNLVESQRELIVRDWQQRRDEYVRQAEAQGPTMLNFVTLPERIRKREGLFKVLNRR